eukprot:13750843-Ditylum_brightwellii.AAC.1
MKLSSNATKTCISHEGITNLASLSDFNKKSIKDLLKICKESVVVIAEDIPNGIAAETAVHGANLSLISV